VEVPKAKLKEEAEIRSRLDELAAIIQTRGWSAIEAEKKEGEEIELKGRVLSATEEKPRMKM
jgi:hypothetical protein